MSRSNQRRSGECRPDGLIPPAPGFYRVWQVFHGGHKTLWLVCRCCWFSYEIDFDSSPHREPNWKIHNKCPRCGREGEYASETSCR